MNNTDYSELKIEFLITTEEQFNKIISLNTNSFPIKKDEISPKEETKSWLVSIKSKQEDCDILAEFRDRILESIGTETAHLVEDQCSEFYSDKLYPLCREFEYLLRKLIYIGLYFNNAPELTRDVNKLECKTLNELFEIIFVDYHFGISFAKRFNRNKENPPKITKQDLLNFIDNTEENSLWDKYIGKTVSQTLKKENKTIRTIRNNVMHFSVISASDFLSWEALLTKVITDLKEAIFKFTSKPEKRKNIIKPGFSDAFLSSVDIREKLSDIPLSSIWNTLDFNQAGFNTIELNKHSNEIFQNYLNYISALYTSKYIDQPEINLYKVNSIYKGIGLEQQQTPDNKKDDDKKKSN